MDKKQAREHMKLWRKGLSEDFVADTSSRICDHLRSASDWQTVGSIHIYQPLEASNEVATKPFIEWINLNFPDTRIWLQSSKPEFPDDFYDVVIVPCLAIDKHGNRVGYGGASYDSFLRSQKNAKTIALAYKQQIVDELSSEAHDIPIQFVVSETGTMKTSLVGQQP